VLLFGEQEHLIKRVLPHHRMPVRGQGQPALLAEIPQRVEVLADALLLFQREPVPVQ
jgi:hypothetical protein